MPTSSTRQQKNWYWPDFSRFCFDLAPKDVTYGWDDEQTGGIYDIPLLPDIPYKQQVNPWTNWIDKFQTDYRFLALSDENAACNLFPEVQDPWMFTEYVYEGEGMVRADDPAPNPIGIVEPPLAAPHRVVREFNEDGSTKSSNLAYLNETATTFIPAEPRYAFELEYRWKSQVADPNTGERHLYWESELDVLGWREIFDGGMENADFDRTDEMRRRVRFQHPSINAGVRLNRAVVWAHSTRWGQSQNVPDRIVNLTGPPDWFRLKDRLTGRIVPHINIIQGQPVYDVCSNALQQGAVRYTNITLNQWNWGGGMQIGLTSVVPAGANGVSDAVFTYPVPADNNAAALCPLPVDEGGSHPRYQWKEILYQTGDLVHRGCSFWKGSAGQANCTYAVNYIRTENIVPFAATYTLVRPASPSSEAVEIAVAAGAGGPWLTLPGALTLAMVTNPDGSVSDITLTGTPPANTNYMRVRIVAKDRPIPHGVLCGSYDNGSADQKSAYGSRCQVQGVQACPFYTAQGARIVATFEAQASNGAEWANMQRGLPANYKKTPMETSAGQAFADIGGASGVLGAGVPAAMAYAFISAIPTPDPYLAGVPKESRLTTQITFEPEQVPVDGKQRYYNTSDGTPPRTDPESAIRLKAGTGFHVIDWKDDESYQGVDTPFFGMVNQINYRVLHPIQHCYRQDKCDPIILGGKPAPGWRRGSYSAINFTSHALRMPGYPAFDESQNYCRLGNNRCPKTNLDRRASEFSSNYKLLIDEILLPFRVGGISAFGGLGGVGGLEQVFIDAGIVYTNLTPTSFQSDHPTAICAAAALDDGHPPLLGHFQPLVKDGSGNAWRIFFFYDRPSWDLLHQQSKVTAHLIQFRGDDQPAYMTITDDADRQAAARMYGNADQVPWLVELQENYINPLGNVLFATNPNPMAGGRSPEYRDITKRGRQIMCEMGGEVDSTGATGRTETNQFGGPLWNRSQVTDRSRMAYWTEKNGFHIVTSMPLWNRTAVPTLPQQPLSAADTDHAPFVGVEPRIINKPQAFNGAIPINGVPNLAIFDPESGGQKMSNYARVGHTYSTDTPEVLLWFKEIVGVDPDDGHSITRWESMLPEDPDDLEGKKIDCRPPSCAPDMLPLNRVCYQCSVCKLDFTEEEVNFLKDAHTPPLVVMPLNPPAGAVCGCPRYCGGAIMPAGSYDHFLDTRAKGQIDIWAPPGTTVRRDGFFWKNPTLISRVHYDQFLRKLGGYKAVTGGYGFQYLTPTSNNMGTLPQTLAQFYNPGLAHQLISPWAKAGDTIADVRQRVKDVLKLRDSDSVQIQRYQGSEPPSPLLTSSIDPSTPLLVGDQIMFSRKEDPDLPPHQIGMTIQVASGPPAGIMNEPVVTADDVVPVRSEFPEGEQGDRLFEEAIKQWRIGIVKSTMELWGTAANIGMAKNALFDQLAQITGASATEAEEFDPATNVAKPLDERIISPYMTTGQYGGGLKIITMPQLKELRNRVLPILAYDLSDDGYSAGGDYTRMAQQSTSNRFSIVRKELPFKRWGVIPPQILAATESGWDYYVEWDTGGVVEDKARAYYPVGTTWWRINQMVGQIKRKGGTNPLHMDDSSDAGRAKNPDGSPTAMIPYTGDIITSSCAYFLHGRIPMHMEVVKAYCIFTPNSGPSAAPLGCQGRYTGYQAYQYADGPHWDSKFYVGHQNCYWQHFHPWTQAPAHEADKGACQPGGYGYWFDNSRRHPEERWTQYSLNDEFAGLLQSDAIPPLLVPQLSLQGEGGGPEGYVSAMGIDSQVNYMAMVDILGFKFNDESWGFEFTQPFIKPWSWGENLQQNMTEYQVWKDLDFANYGGLKDRYHTIGMAAVNTTESVLTFDYFTEEYRSVIWPREHQGIPGWINYTNYSTDPNFGKFIGIAAQVTDSSWASGPQTIVQAASSGGNGPGNAGSIPRVMDITNTIKNLYNNRVTRFYNCKLGWGYGELKIHIPALTDTNLGQANRFHTGWREPEYYVNYRYVDASYGLWLNDPWHHAPLVGQNSAPISVDGDPIQFSDETHMSRVSNVSRWDTQGLPSSDANYLQYHPWQLCQADQTLVEGGPILTPAPEEFTGRFWRSTSGRAVSQSFEMDLRSTPLETSRRPFRYQQPQIDSSNATCPNVARCWVAQRGWTVGQFYERATSSWGVNIIPSTTSDHCANCGTLLTGVTYIGGDGIVTCTYDPPFTDNPLVTNLQIACDDGSGNPPRHGFSVEYFNTLANAWRVLFTVVYDPVAGQYSFHRWNGSAWVTATSFNLPPVFLGVEGVADIPKNQLAANGAHFVAVAAARLRFNVLRPASQPGSYPAGGAWGGCTPSPATNEVIVAALDGNAGDYVQRTITLKNAQTNAIRKIMIVEVTANSGTGGGRGGYRLRLADAVGTSDTQFNIAWTQYVALCSKFRIFGWPYRTADLTITPPAFVQPIYFGPGNNTFHLNTWATKVLSVEATVGDQIGVILDRSDARDADNFYWTTRQVTFGGNTYLEISGGKFYFDYGANSIVIPDQYLDPTDGNLYSVWELNSDLYGDPNSTFAVQTLPRSLAVEYLTGTGVPVDIPVEASGAGPSYQLDRECVQFIAGHGTDNEDVPGDVISNPGQVLPDMGHSEKIVTNDHQPYRLYWQVYNHDPIVWDVAPAWLVGDELGAGQWDDNSILGVFSGGHGPDISNCGPNAALGGKATGTVTFYGLPNTILSGNLAVYAKAYTTRTYHLASGQTVTTAERTGGYKSGAFVFRLAVNQTMQNGQRKSLGCDVPKILVYLRERDSDPNRDPAPLK